MNKVLEFFQEELLEYCKIKSDIESEVHRAHIDVEFLSNTKNKIILESDNTYDIFCANSNQSNFYNNEVILLDNQISDIENMIEVKYQELVDVDKRINKYNEMIVQCKNPIALKNDSNISGIDILEIQEKERQRIARDIHDSVVQKMTSLIYRSEFTLKVFDSDLQRAKIELEVSNRIIRECISELRGIIFDLRPMSLDDLGLEITLKQIIEQFNSITDIDINLVYSNEKEIEVNAIVSITVLRIIQELCSNAIKYSRAKEINVNISICAKEKIVFILFEDNGIGIIECDIDSTKKDKTGFGLMFLKERIKLLNGSVNIDTGGDKVGTRYTIQIPLHIEEK